MEFVILLLFMMFEQFDYKVQKEKYDNYNENVSEVKKMTLEEVKDALLDKIGFLLENADADDVRTLSEAYANLYRDSLLKKVADQSSTGFGAIGNPYMGNMPAESKND